MANLMDGKLELLTDKNSVLVLVDYQPSMFKGVASGDKTIIRNAAISAANAASILGVPVRGPGMLSRRQGGRKLSFQDCGPACALHTQLCMP